MEGRAEDYYDIPAELLPTPNFANRPMSEITMLDGMTFVISSSSSSADEEDTTAPPRSSIEPTESALLRPEIREMPKITITAPSEADSGIQSRSSNGGMKILSRPQLKKAHTAPPGALRLPNFLPPQPRRAISARTGHSKTTKGRIAQSVPVDRSPLTGRRTLGDKTAEPQGQLPLVPGPTKQEDTFQRITEKEPASSFSRKARVKGTLKKKQMGMLDTDIADYEAKRTPNSPNSMLSTPREMYGIPNQHSTTELVPSLRSRKRKSLTSISPSTSSSTAQSAIQSRDEFVEDISRNAHLLRQRPVYLPGPICLEERPTKPRIDSVASTESFEPAFAAKANRFSDMVGLDGIVMFFEDFGVVEQVTEETLDKYWLDENRRDPKNRQSITSVEETASEGPRKARSLRRSKFSFSSASSTASVPPPGTAKRQRIRLRRLLSPALPGSAFLKTPASRGKETETS